MIQLELQFLETEIQTARDYGLMPGERPDGLENLKDLLDKGSNDLGEALGVDVKGLKKEVTTAFDKTLDAASAAAAKSSRNRG